MVLSPFTFFFFLLYFKLTIKYPVFTIYQPFHLVLFLLLVIFFLGFISKLGLGGEKSDYYIITDSRLFKFCWFIFKLISHCFTFCIFFFFFFKSKRTLTQSISSNQFDFYTTHLINIYIFGHIYGKKPV